MQVVGREREGVKGRERQTCLHSSAFGPKYGEKKKESRLALRKGFILR